MRSIKQIVLTLLLPVAAFSQTAHVEEDRVAYKGTVSVANAGKADLFGRAKIALSKNIKGNQRELIEENKESGNLIVKGSIRLITPYHLIRKVKYIFELSVQDGEYKYRIDSVCLEEKERGEKKVILSSDKLLKAVEATGPESIAAEKLLNEMDMNFQKIIVLINASMTTSSIAINKNGD